ncbi:MAG TPA: YraN family protein [Saprospiraceae bacterium]|nr:YraN family protein [Saprospiraceae bacterium]HMP15243.1 YraN family protein [Saprospiraceae bacterium]
MAKHIETGQAGEALAQAFLKRKGYRILETNWRFSKAEVDIIAIHEHTLVFVEVKTRSSDRYGQPEEFISDYKERLLADAASVYMEQIEHEAAIRFDVIAIVYRSAEDYHITHFEDAFFPGLE